MPRLIKVYKQNTGWAEDINLAGFRMSKLGDLIG